ncbi:MAG TPA: hypothetical protein VGM72_02535 [Micropepsaceae bacterium]|jgi:hypothetical protein
MRIRFDKFVYSAAIGLLAAMGPARAAANDEVPTALMSAAECMVRTLKAMPGVTEVQIRVSAGQGGAYPVLQYRFADAFGGRRFTEVSLFEIVGAADPFVFDKADIDEDVVAERLLPVWKARCHSGFGYITSQPQ